MEEEPEEPEVPVRKSTLADLYDLVAGARALVVDVSPGVWVCSPDPDPPPIHTPRTSCVVSVDMLTFCPKV